MALWRTFPAALCCRKSSPLTRSTSSSAPPPPKPPPSFRPSLVIFDKDGTLICFHTMWSPWVLSLARRLQQATGLNDLNLHLFDLLGYDHSAGKVRIGALAENTHPQIKTKIVDMLHSNKGFTHSEAHSVVASSWRDAPEAAEMREAVKLTCDVEAAFKRLRAAGVAVAVCTSDSKEGTHAFLKGWNLSKLVDVVICGDDRDSRPKPDPYNAYRICKELNVRPEEAVMIGDTPADTLMGQQAGLGLTIGVLSGVGDFRDLNEADVIVSDVREAVDLLLPDVAASRGKVYSVTATGIAKIAKGASPWGGHQYRPFSTSGMEGHGGPRPLIPGIPNDFGSNRVLLLEAGPSDTLLGSRLLQWKIHMPAALMFNLCDDRYNWFYHTQPQVHMDNRVMYWPRGRVWGGSSSINAMVYIRGHALDYDRWEKEGASGWSYAHCLPYFKRAQNHSSGPDQYRGGDGPLHVTRHVCDNVLHHVFLEAAQQAGHALTEDVNGYRQEGVGWFDMTIHNGMRWSAASAYLHPALSRPNLKVEDNLLVEKIVFEGKTAKGVQYIKDGQVHTARADQVILCAGAINSPQLLMLSGVGPASHLRQMSVAVVADSPGVGANLQDHLEIYVVHKCKKPVSLLREQKGLRQVAIGVKWFLSRKGPCSSAHLESGGFTRSRPGVPHPDIMFHFLPSQVVDHGRKVPEHEAFQLHVGPMRATSIGEIKLKSKDPREHPIINPNYLATETDRWEMRESVRLSREIFSQPAFSEYSDGELQPGVALESDADLDAFVRKNADSAYHPSCTCKMGDPSKDGTVVDSQLRVLGVEGVRVVDASVMPSVVSGNLNAPVIMLAERAADIILGGKMLPPASDVPVYKPDTLEKRR